MFKFCQLIFTTDTVEKWFLMEPKNPCIYSKFSQLRCAMLGFSSGNPCGYKSSPECYCELLYILSFWVSFQKEKHWDPSWVTTLVTRQSKLFVKSHLDTCWDDWEINCLWQTKARNWTWRTGLRLKILMEVLCIISNFAKQFKKSIK